MALRIEIKSAKYKNVDGEGRWLYEIHTYQHDIEICVVFRRYSEIHSMHDALTQVGIIMAHIKLPKLPE